MRTDCGIAIYQSSTTTNRASKAPYDLLCIQQGQRSLCSGRAGDVLMQDNLSDLLQTVRVESACCIRAELTAPWGCRHDKSLGALFYICLNGSACIEIIGTKQTAVLQSGDCAILPHGSAHIVRDSLTSPVAASIPAPCADVPAGFPVIPGGCCGGLGTVI